MIYSGDSAFTFVCCYFHIDKAEARNWDSKHSSVRISKHVGGQLKPVLQLLILASEPFRDIFLVLHPTTAKAQMPRKVYKMVDISS